MFRGCVKPRCLGSLVTQDVSESRKLQVYYHCFGFFCLLFFITILKKTTTTDPNPLQSSYFSPKYMNKNEGRVHARCLVHLYSFLCKNGKFRCRAHTQSTPLLASLTLGFGAIPLHHASNARSTCLRKKLRLPGAQIKSSSINWNVAISQFDPGLTSRWDWQSCWRSVGSA